MDNTNSSLVKVESSAVLKGNQLLKFTNSTLANHYSDLFKWWGGLDEDWKAEFLNVLENSSNSTDREDMYTPSISELFKIILTSSLILSRSHKNLDPLKELHNLIEFCNGDRCFELEDISGLEGLSILKWVYIDSFDLKSIVSLQNAAFLETLILINSNIEDLNPLKNLKELKVLVIVDNGVLEKIDLNPLSNLNNLQQIDIVGLCKRSSFINLSPLSNLCKLKSLSCSHNNILDLQFLKDLVHLEYLDLSFVTCKVNTLKSIADLKKLKTINIRNSNITDIEPIYYLSNIKKLYIENAKIEQIQINQLQKFNPDCEIIGAMSFSNEKAMVQANIIHSDNINHISAKRPLIWKSTVEENENPNNADIENKINLQKIEYYYWRRIFYDSIWMPFEEDVILWATEIPMNIEISSYDDLMPYWENKIELLFKKENRIEFNRFLEWYLPTEVLAPGVFPINDYYGLILALKECFSGWWATLEDRISSGVESDYMEYFSDLKEIRVLYDNTDLQGLISSYG